MDINKNRYVHNIAGDKWLILGIIGIIVAWAVIYLATLYKPSYTSTARVWIRSLADQSFVSPYPENNQIQPQSTDENPILTQLEILNSRYLTVNLANYIEQKYPQDLKGIKDKASTIAGILKAKNITGTQIIDIKLESNSPQKAQDLLTVALKEYENTSLLLNKKINTQRRIFIDRQIEDIQKRLVHVRSAIKYYEKNNLVTSLEDESSGLIKQKIDFVTQLENINASINDTRGKINAIEGRLSLNLHDALNAVALGSYNDNLNKLKDKLNGAEQQYSFDSVNFAYTNPKMVALKNQINIVKRQIRNQVKTTIGKELDKQEINIYDPVREKLVEELATSQAALMGLQAQKGSLISAISKVNTVQASIPDKKFILNTLNEEERNLSSAYDSLRAKQIEANLREAEAVSNITVIDTPDLPAGKSFPTASHVLLLSLMIGSIFAFGASILKTRLEGICQGAEEIENITNSPILGTIPWIKSYFDDNNKLIQDFAIKNIVSSLIFKCQRRNINTITFTSTSLQKNKAYFLYNLASSLRQLGHSVVIVDADLTVPVIHKDISLDSTAKVDLSDMILKIEEKIRHNETIYPELILNMLNTGKNDLKILGNIISVDTPYEYFGSSGFDMIISILKNNFDWVLIDCPPANIAPEFMSISAASDGVVLLVDFKATYSALSRITRQLEDSKITLLGSIIREQNSILEKDYMESVNRVNTAKFEEEKTYQV